MGKRKQASPLDFDERVERIVRASVIDLPTDEKVLLDMITHPDCGLNWLMPDAVEGIRDRFLLGDGDGALGCALDAIERLVHQVCVVACSTSESVRRFSAEMNTVAKRRATRKTGSDNRKGTILTVYRELSSEHLAKGRMHVYKHIAKLSVGTAWKCSSETVRKALSGKD